MRRALLPTTGVVAAVAAAVSGWAPIAQSSPSTPVPKDEGIRSTAADSADGTYESCGAYFGFGKDAFGVIDVVEFDVTDQNGDDGVVHAVPADTQVVLELTNEDGDVIECAAVEVSEAEWDDAMGDVELYIPQEGTQLPTWPGAGHYAYPSVIFEPEVEDFGVVVDVGFRVVSVPTGHTLVSPTAAVPLVQHQLYAKFDNSNLADPRVLALIADEAGAAAADAFEAGIIACGGEAEVVFSADLVAAVNVLQAYRGFEPVTADSATCWDHVVQSNHDVSFLLGLYETVDYAEPIVLTLPEETTTTQPGTTTTTRPPVAQSSGATPVPGSPAYTG